MSANRRKGNVNPTHRRIGDAIGVAGKLVDVNLTCTSCMSEHTVPFSTREPFARQERETECLFCGRAGLMRQRHNLPRKTA